MNGVKGCLTVQVTGYNPERFFNLVKAAGIEIHEVRCLGDRYEFCMEPGQFRRLKPLVKKSGVKLRIIKKTGVYFYIKKHRARLWYPFGCLLFFCFLYSLSFFVWRIDFQGNERFTDEYLTSYLDRVGIRAGMLKRQISCEELEAMIREEFNEITWVSAQVTGTSLSIRIKENEVLLYVPEQEETPCDLIASKDGVITHMVVRSGVPMVKIGDAVTKGQVLVSGRVPITDDSETVVSEHLVTADADVQAAAQTNLTKTVSRVYRAESATGKTRKGCYLNVMGHQFTYILPTSGDTIWKTVREEHQLHFTKDFYVPVYWGTVTSREYEAYDRFYTKQELEDLAQIWMMEELEKLEEKGIQILTNNVKIKISGSKCRMSLHLKTEEDITEQAAIEKTETGEVNERN